MAAEWPGLATVVERMFAPSWNSRAIARKRARVSQTSVFARRRRERTTCEPKPDEHHADANEAATTTSIASLSQRTAVATTSSTPTSAGPRSIPVAPNPSFHHRCPAKSMRIGWIPLSGAGRRSTAVRHAMKSL